MTRKIELKDQANALVTQRHQLNSAEERFSLVHKSLETMSFEIQDNQHNLDDMLAQAEQLLRESEVLIVTDDACAQLVEKDIYKNTEKSYSTIPLIDEVDYIQVEAGAEWENYFILLEEYAGRQNLQLKEDPFLDLMTPSQRIDLERRIQSDFALKNACCDRYDYMIACTCGLIGGLIDVLFVGSPGQGKLTKAADNLVDSSVQKFAKLFGWTGPKDGKDPTSSAIGYLETKFPVNYDHRHGGDVGGLFKMSTKNHHIKNLAHSPDLIGLFFSIVDQFNSTAHFVDNGSIIVIDTDKYELRGTTLISKLFSGFVNWIGHLFSDVAGSSGALDRGSGIPIPFYSLLQFVNIGEFGQHRHTFAKIAVQVFERGYDLRHGIALAVPVLVTELLTRMCWVIKQRIYHKSSWQQCIPSVNNPELHRMLLVAHGSLCLVDISDAALRSGGNVIQFLLRSNLIAWVRLGTLALKELKSWYCAGSIDVEAVDEYLDAEYRRLLLSV